MISLPRWEDLPALDLYLDQVLLYVNQETRSAIVPNEKKLTASMVNNYVKLGYLDKPVKKKYGRAQLARLIVLTLCKPIFPIATIHETIELLKAEQEASSLYNDFVACLATDNKQTHPLVHQVCQTLLSYHQTLALLSDYSGGNPYDPKP